MAKCVSAMINRENSVTSYIPVFSLSASGADCTRGSGWFTEFCVHGGGVPVALSWLGIAADASGEAAASRARKVEKIFAGPQGQ